MRFYPFLLLLASVLASGPLLAQSAGTIAFNGEITDQTCDVTVGGSNQAKLTLPKVSLNDFSGVNSVAGLTPFVMVFDRCRHKDDGTLSVSVQFTVPGDKTTGGNLDNTEKRTGIIASGIGVQLTKDENGKEQIRLGNDSLDNKFTLNLDFKGGSASHTFGAQYIKLDNSASAGKVSATVNYKVTYL